MPVFLWTQKQDIGASSRAGHAMAYDAARKLTVLFGGSRSSSLLGDTWPWAADLWTQVADTGPTARDACAMSYDASRPRVMLFGGTRAVRSSATLGSGTARTGHKSPTLGRSLAPGTRSRMTVLGTASYCLEVKPARA